VRHDPARQALAAAIAAATSADAAAAHSREVLARAESFLNQAKVRRVQAEEALSRTLAEHSENLVSAIASGASPTSGAEVRTARARLADAEDELAAAIAAFEKLSAAVADPEAISLETKRAVEKEIAVVVGAHVAPLLEAAQRAQHIYFEHCVALSEAKRLLHPWGGEYKAADHFLASAGLAFHRHVTTSNVPSAAAIEWRRAVGALTVDATVRLPIPQAR